MSSASEEEIRAAVVGRLRELMPDARIVHELNVAGQGSNRIDVAAIGKQAIVGVEIKSRKDVLKRLDEQGRSANNWRDAAAFVARIDTMPAQLGWGF